MPTTAAESTPSAVSSAAASSARVPASYPEAARPLAPNPRKSGAMTR
ncbi:hypothetical protein J2S51_007087 [Streptomyces sp. DSM 41269]|nr:hypothetical protein [Streptomyces sp. DSM 41269]